MLRTIAVLCAFFSAHTAYAGCTAANRGGIPFSCDAANIPSSLDLFLGGSRTGSNAGQAVAYTGGQIIAMDHSASPVTSNGVTKPLSSWMMQLLAVPTTPITVGGQSIYPGGATANQGNGPLIALAAGTFVPGHCRQTDSNGNEVDSGATCGGGGGGSGSVTSGTVNQLAWYASTGPAVTGLTTTPSGVLVTNGAGVPAIGSTLPAGLTISAPTILGANLTGTTSVGALNASGPVSTPASTTNAAGLTITPGTGPASPVNGNIWVTAAGVNAQVNGQTVLLGSGGLASISAAAPLSGSGTSGSPLTCATCATTASGGPLTATAPLAISSTGVISLGAVPGSALVQWPTAVQVAADTYYFTLAWPWASGTITKLIYATGGTSPSFSIAVQIAGASVTGCSGVTVTSATVTTTTCTGANTIMNGQPVTLAVTAVSGTPSAAQVQVSYLRSAN